MTALNEQQMYIHKAVVGDESDDGHGKWDTVFFKCSLSREEIRAGLAKARSELDNSIDNLFSDYEDNRIPNALIEELEKYGYKLPYDCEEYQGKYYLIGADGLVQFYMSVINVFTPCTWNITRDDTSEVSFPSSGYGLYH